MSLFILSVKTEFPQPKEIVMISRVFNIGLLVILITCVGLFSQQIQVKKNVMGQGDIRYVPGQFIVKLRSNDATNSLNKTALSSIMAQYGIMQQKQFFSKARNSKVVEKLNLNNVFLMYTNESANIQNIVNELNANPAIEYAEPNYIFEIDAIPNDALYSSQYHLPQVKAPDGWDIQAGDTSVIVGIIDTGVDWDHEDLQGVIWRNKGEIPDNGMDDDSNGYIDDTIGWDFVDGIVDAHTEEDADTSDNNPMDFDGHGTHVAGIAAAHTNNVTGVAAVSWGTRIMPLRCGWRASNDQGYVSSAFAAQAYIYAADNGAHITNQSSGNSGQTIVEAAFYAFLNNVLIVESAGNSNSVSPSALGSQFFVMSVASVNSQDQKASYSSFGDYVDVSAPGGDFSTGNGQGILSTILYPSNLYGGSKYIQFQGTSMAAPLAASVAALVKQKYPNMNVVDLFTHVEKTADNIDYLNSSYAGLLGNGRVNAYRALTETPVALPNFKLSNITINDPSGNNNGFIDPGENVVVEVKLRNMWQDATNVYATLFGDNTWPLTIVGESVSLGNVAGVKDTANWEVDVQFNLVCDVNAIPQVVDLSLWVSADGGYSDTLDISISVSPLILLVDDDDGNNNVEDYYTDALEKLGLAYDIWNHLIMGTPSAQIMSYPVVIWLCEWAFPSLTATDRDRLTDYLEGGGRLFLSGQDIGWDLADPTGAVFPNEYGRSEGASLNFYQNYLKAHYISDASETDNLWGVVDDPIGHDLYFRVYQPGRTTDNQYPSEINPINGSFSIFNYQNLNSGAVRYEGDYRVVYFAFGGYEAITENEIRQEVMERVVGWLNGIYIEHTPFNDTENITDPYTISANITSIIDNIASVTLLWDVDGELPFKAVPMIDQGDGLYVGDIPPQANGNEIQYTILAKTILGTYPPIEFYSFHVGRDTISPVISLINRPYWGTVNPFGPEPYEFVVEISDNLGVDTSTAYIHFGKNNETSDSIKMKVEEEGIFKGTFNFDNPLSKGDLVKYFFSVKDLSMNGNKTNSQIYSYQIDTTELIDNFEGDLYKWDLGNGWGKELIDDTGSFSITDSPYGLYDNNEENSLIYKYSFNLTNYNSAWIEYSTRYLIEADKDSCNLEASTNNGQNWEILKTYTGVQLDFTKEIIDISEYTAEGIDDFKIRFRMISNESIMLNGIWIDDVIINVSFDTTLTAINDPLTKIFPDKFALQQNYPNPFNPSTKIAFSIPERQKLELTVFNILGQKIRTLASGTRNAGQHSVIWDGTDDFGEVVSSGIYFYQLKTRDFLKTKKMMYLQ